MTPMIPRTVGISLAFCTVLFARQLNELPTIEGIVSGDRATAIAGATITLDSITRSFHRETQTNASGHYSFQDLEPGAYALCADVTSYGCIIHPHLVVAQREHLRQDFAFTRVKQVSEACKPPTLNEKRQKR